MVLLGDEAQVQAHFGVFGDSACLTQDRCAVCAEHTIGSEIVLDAPMELLGDTGHVESRFSLFGDGVSVGARQVHGLHQMYRRLRTHFGRTQWYFMVMRLKWMLDSICLEIGARFAPNVP